MSLNTLQVLLIDDDPVFRSMIVDFLCSRHATVYEATHAEQGLELCQDHAFDVVIIDLSLPKMIGLKALQTLSELNISIPRIVLSAHDVTEFVAQALRLGASDYLIKPLEDMMEIEYAIKRSLAVEYDFFDDFFDEEHQIEDLEFADHIQYLSDDNKLASYLQSQLYNPPHIGFERASLHHSFKYQQAICPYYLDVLFYSESKMVFCFALTNSGNHVVFSHLLLRTLLNQKFHAGRIQQRLLLEPLLMIREMNQHFLQAGVSMPVNLVYGFFEVKDAKLSLAYTGAGVEFFLKEDNELFHLFMEHTPALGTCETKALDVTLKSLQLDTNQVLVFGCHQEPSAFKAAAIAGDFKGTMKTNEGTELALVELNPDSSFMA
jgi:DNA-binding NarL/FixJ family response regulator